MVRQTWVIAGVAGVEELDTNGSPIHAKNALPMFGDRCSHRRALPSRTLMARMQRDNAMKETQLIVT